MAAESPPPDQQHGHYYVLKNISNVSRILVIISIFGTLIASVLVILAGFAELFKIISFLIHEGVLNEELGTFLSVTVTEMIDLYLIGLVLIIFALGLYQLFINPELSVPEWMETTSLDTLEARLLIVIIVVLAVMFLGYVATAADGIFIAGLGIAVSAVIIAIGYFLTIHSRATIEPKRLEVLGDSQKGTDQDR